MMYNSRFFCFYLCFIALPLHLLQCKIHVGAAGRLPQQHRHQCGLGRFSCLDCKLLQAVARYWVRNGVLDFSMVAGVGLTRKKMQGQGWG